VDSKEYVNLYLDICNELLTKLTFDKSASDNSNQHIFFVTLDKKSSIESQRLLCVNLAKRFNEFPNILICLYADNPSGKDLANGNDEFVSVEDQKRSWLAMYSYNSVEGEYFDDSPSSYLGAY